MTLIVKSCLVMWHIPNFVLNRFMSKHKLKILHACCLVLTKTHFLILNLSTRALEGYKGSWSETGCPQNWKIQISHLLRSVLRVSLQKLIQKNSWSDYSAYSTPNLSETVFLGELIIFTQILRSGKFEFSKLGGHPVSDQLPP